MAARMPTAVSAAVRRDSTAVAGSFNEALPDRAPHRAAELRQCAVIRCRCLSLFPGVLSRVTLNRRARPDSAPRSPGCSGWRLLELLTELETELHGRGRKDVGIVQAVVDAVVAFGVPAHLAAFIEHIVDVGLEGPAV